MGTHLKDGIDHMCRQLGGDDAGRSGTTTSGPTATTATDTGASFTASSGTPGNGGLVGHQVVMGNNVWGTIISNSGTVLTIDYWHNPTNPATVASTPATGGYIVLPGGAPSFWIGLSTASRAVTSSDHFLTNDGATISEIFGAANAGLSRQLATSYTHTNGTSTFSFSHAFTATAGDGTPLTVNTYGVFAAGVQAAPTTTTTGPIQFAGAMPSPPTLQTSDQLTVTETVTVT